MISLVPYSESSDDDNSDSDVQSKQIPSVTKISSNEDEKNEDGQEKKSTKPIIPSFLDTFDAIEKPSFLKNQRTTKQEVVKYFDLNEPIKKKAMTAEESKEDQEKKEAERKLKEEKEKEEAEKQNEEERKERVRQERQLIDELHQLRREGREKWNQQQKRMKRLAQANNEAAKKRKMKE